MSSSVCRPLKRAKSTVGEPLSSATLLPLASVAVMLFTCTAKEVTLASGASVPITKAGPETPPVTGFVSELPQPAASSEATARERRQGRGVLRNDREGIGHSAFCALRILS